MTEGTSGATTPVDVVYSWDMNCLRATPVGRPNAVPKCVHFGNYVETITVQTKNGLVTKDRLCGGRALRPHELRQVATANFGDGMVRSFTYLKKGEGYLLPSTRSRKN